MQLDLVKLEELEGDELLKYVSSFDQEVTTDYASYYDEWEKNLLFYLGHHWLEKSGTTDGYSILEDDDEHFRPVANYIAQNCDIKRSQIVGKRTHAIVRSNSENYDDQVASKLGYLALKAKHSLDDEETLEKISFLQAQIFGGCWRADYKKIKPQEYIEIPRMDKKRTEFFQCDKCGMIQDETSTCPECGNPDTKYIRDEVEEAVLDEMGNPVVERVPTYETAIAIPDVFSMKCGNGKLLKDLQWVQQSNILPLDWVKRAFDVEAEGFFPETASKLKSTEKFPRPLKLSHEFQSTVAQYHSSLEQKVSKGTSLPKYSTIVNKLYHAPTEKYPFGCLIIWTPTGVLYRGKPDVVKDVMLAENLQRWHPYNYFPYKLDPMKILGIPYIKGQIPLNIKINAMDSMIMEHLDRCASPDRVQFENVLSNENDQSDGILRVSARPDLPNGGAPFYLSHPQLSSEVYKMRDRYVQEIREEGNVTDIMRGIRPTGVDTYSGMQLLRDASDSAESDLFGRWHKFKRDCGELKLALIQDCLLSDNPQITRMMDTIRQNENLDLYAITEFAGEDLRNNHNVVIEEIDYAGQSKAAEAERLQTLVKSGILPPEDLQDPLVKDALLTKFGLDILPVRMMADVEKGRRMIQYIEKQRFDLVQQFMTPFDNAGVLMKVLVEWTKSAKYETLDPQVKQFVAQVALPGLKQKVEALKATAPQPPREGAGAPPPGARPPGPPPGPPPRPM